MPEKERVIVARAAPLRCSSSSLAPATDSRSQLCCTCLPCSKHLALREAFTLPSVPNLGISGGIDFQNHPAPTQEVYAVFGHPLTSHAHEADIIRLEVLLEFGGVQPARGCPCPRTIHHLLPNTGRGLSNALASSNISPAPNADFLARWYRMYRQGHWALSLIPRLDSAMRQAARAAARDDSPQGRGAFGISARYSRPLFQQRGWSSRPAQDARMVEQHVREHATARPGCSWVERAPTRLVVRPSSPGLVERVRSGAPSPSHRGGRRMFSWATRARFTRVPRHAKTCAIAWGHAHAFA